MRNIKQYLWPLLFVFTSLIFLSYSYYLTFYTPSVKVGDVWRWTYGDSDNPYENVKVYTYQVMEVKNGYVKSLNLRDSTIDIEKQRFFRHYDLISRSGAIIIYIPQKK